MNPPVSELADALAALLGKLPPTAPYTCVSASWTGESGRLLTMTLSVGAAPSDDDDEEEND